MSPFGIPWLPWCIADTYKPTHFGKWMKMMHHNAERKMACQNKTNPKQHEMSSVSGFGWDGSP